MNHSWRTGLKRSLWLALCCGTVVSGADRSFGKIDFPSREVFKENFDLFRQRAAGEAPLKVDPELQFESEEKGDGYTRHLVSYNVEKDDRIRAWLLVPDHQPGDRLPLVICLHPTAVIGKDVEILRYPTTPENDAERLQRENRAHALDLVKRGFICFAPDRAGYGERSPLPNETNAIKQQRAYIDRFNEANPDRSYLYGKVLTDLQRALDFLTELDEVDAERIGVIGHSLGGWDSLGLIAMDPRVKAAVINCGGDLDYRPELWTDAAEQRKLIEGLNTRSRNTSIIPNLLLMAAAPRAVLYMKAINDAGADYPNTMLEGARMMSAYYRFLAPGKNPALAFLWFNDGHDMPYENRQYAYLWLERTLKK